MASVFDIPQALESINSGASRYDTTLTYPISGNVSGVNVGSGAASGLSTFQWQDSNLWWSPRLSYFVLDVTFLKAGGVPAISDYVAYADNFVSTLFSQIKTQINSRQLDIIDVPYVIDTALTYANQKKTFIQSWASMSHTGEGFMTRLKNTCANGGTVEIAFRPPVSLFDCKLLPPGAQFRVDFNWAPNAQMAFESIFTDITLGSSSNQYQVQVNNFGFYKATLAPSPQIPLPEAGVIDLCPTIVNQYFCNNTNQLKQNITLPSTTNRILAVLQDNYKSQITGSSSTGGGAQSYTPGIGTGWNPATSFSLTFTDQSSTLPFNCAINQMWLTLPELGVQLPNPVYTITALTAGNSTNPSQLVLNQQDIQRAYADFCTVTQGNACGDEGSVPIGSMDFLKAKANLMEIYNTFAAAILQPGTPENLQQLVLYDNSTNATNLSITPVGLTIAANANNGYQTARWGWAGRCPGPIFAFPVVRPEGKTVSTGNFNVTFNAAAANVVVSILCTYSMAISLQHVGNGLYSYSIVEGV
jgi:hypothetical protein